MLDTTTKVSNVTKSSATETTRRHFPFLEGKGSFGSWGYVASDSKGNKYIIKGIPVADASKAGKAQRGEFILETIAGSVLQEIIPDRAAEYIVLQEATDPTLLKRKPVQDQDCVYMRSQFFKNCTDFGHLLDNNGKIENGNIKLDGLEEVIVSRLFVGDTDFHPGNYSLIPFLESDEKGIWKVKHYVVTFDYGKAFGVVYTKPAVVLKNLVSSLIEFKMGHTPINLKKLKAAVYEKILVLSDEQIEKSVDRQIAKLKAAGIEVSGIEFGLITGFKIRGIPKTKKNKIKDYDHLKQYLTSILLRNRTTLEGFAFILEHLMSISGQEVLSASVISFLSKQKEAFYETQAKPLCAKDLDQLSTIASADKKCLEAAVKHYTLEQLASLPVEKIELLLSKRGKIVLKSSSNKIPSFDELQKATKEQLEKWVEDPTKKLEQPVLSHRDSFIEKHGRRLSGGRRASNPKKRRSIGQEIETSEELKARAMDSRVFSTAFTDVLSSAEKARTSNLEEQNKDDLMAFIGDYIEETNGTESTTSLHTEKPVIKDGKMVLYAEDLVITQQDIANYFAKMDMAAKQKGAIKRWCDRVPSQNEGALDILFPQGR